MLAKENVRNHLCGFSSTAWPRCSVFAVNMVVLRAPAGLPAVPAGRVAGASCSPGYGVPGTAQQAADRPLHDPVLQPYVKGMRRHRHRVLDLLCVAGGLSPHSGDHSKLIDGAAWHRLVSAETRRHHSREETCTQRDDHCDFHSAELCIQLSLSN